MAMRGSVNPGAHFEISFLRRVLAIGHLVKNRKRSIYLNLISSTCHASFVVSATDFCRPNDLCLVVPAGHSIEDRKLCHTFWVSEFLETYSLQEVQGKFLG